ncbi:hypothetical protein J3F83DRAFT_710844 [Trichoderma novae-zelandiae]
MPGMDRYAAESRRLQAMSMPFLNEELMKGPPRFRGQDLRDPRLRRSTLDPKTIVFEAQLGGGSDGYVWKVRFGDEGPFALKVFWDQVPPHAPGSYYSMQRECQNAAVFQMMEASLAVDPVLVYDHPMGKKDAIENYFSFCEENCAPGCIQTTPKEAALPGATYLSTMPRMAKCHGWLKLRKDLWSGLADGLQASHEDPSKVKRLMSSHMDCIGVVYELIEEGENDAAAIEDVDRFLWQAGFAYTIAPNMRDWKNGVLIDHAGIVHIRGYGWNEDDYMKKGVQQMLSELSDATDSPDDEPLGSE